MGEYYRRLRRGGGRGGGECEYHHFDILFKGKRKQFLTFSFHIHPQPASTSRTTKTQQMQLMERKNQYNWNEIHLIQGFCPFDVIQRDGLGI